jgi:hypothetical protein
MGGCKVKVPNTGFLSFTILRKANKIHIETYIESNPKSEELFQAW